METRDDRERERGRKNKLEKWGKQKEKRKKMGVLKKRILNANSKSICLTVNQGRNTYQGKCMLSCK